MTSEKELEDIVRKYRDDNRRGRAEDSKISSRLAAAIKLGDADELDAIVREFSAGHRFEAGADGTVDFVDGVSLPASP